MGWNLVDGDFTAQWYPPSVEEGCLRTKSVFKIGVAVGHKIWPAMILMVFVCWTLRVPLMSFDDGFWGPENAWTNRDFLGAWWLFLSANGAGMPWDSTVQALSNQSWPDGTSSLAFHIPNPFDGWLIGPWVTVDGFPLWWNGLQFFHHTANMLAALCLVRAAGASRFAAIGATCLVASCPVMLHEIAGGRTLSGVAWPGLLGLALLLRNKAPWAGLLIGIQGLCYIYTGLLFGLVALVLRPHRSLVFAALPILPYLWWLEPVWGSLRGEAPPAGHSSLPLGGLLSGWWGVPNLTERFLFQPFLLLGFALPFVRGIERLKAWKWVGLGGFMLLIAVGPNVEWGRGDVLMVSPISWFLSGPELTRMHHPVRTVLLAAPLLAVSTALLLDRLPRQMIWVPLIVAVLCGDRMTRAVPYGVSAEPPGHSAALWLRDNGTAVVDLTGKGGPALGLAPIHNLPMLEGLRQLRPAANRVVPSLREGVDRWIGCSDGCAGGVSGICEDGGYGAISSTCALGMDCTDCGPRAGQSQPLLVEQLVNAGFTHVLAVDRGNGIDTSALEMDLGAPVFPGVYALPVPIMP